MDFFFLVLVVAFFAGIVGVIEEIGPYIVPSLIASAIIIAISLLVSHFKKHK